MGDFEAPSFSLGFDLGFDSEPETTVRETSTLKPATDSTSNRSFPTIEIDGDEFGPQAADSDLEYGPDPEPPRILKRLRRGSGSISENVGKREPENWDDEIEEFSSQEDLRTDQPPSTYRPFMCSSSKLSLQRNRVLSTQTSSQSKARKGKQVSHDPASSSLETSGNKFVFPELTVSPLRRFQLLDSDSDGLSGDQNIPGNSNKIDQSKARKGKQVSHDPASSSLETSGNKFVFPELTVSPLRRFQLLDSDSDGLSGDENIPANSNKIDPLLKQRQRKIGQNVTASGERRTKASSSIPQCEDLWKDFNLTKSSGIPTPALDAICDEYFRSVKEKSVSEKAGTDVFMTDSKGCGEKKYSSENIEQHWDSTEPLPPAHRYFFHDDSRIEKLVHSRLPNFFPLGTVNHIANKQPGGSAIDYMSQFGHGEASKRQATKNSEIRRSSIKVRKNSKKRKGEEISDASGSWVSPKSCASIPKDAGRRRVHAEGHQSAGHWYTGSDGRKVYVSRGGQEFTGQIAYRQYRKESGARFRKSKKKTHQKKK